MTERFDIYPDVTGDSDTWPVLVRWTDENGHQMTARDPGPWNQKQRLAALRMANADPEEGVIAYA